MIRDLVSSWALTTSPTLPKLDIVRQKPSNMPEPQDDPGSVHTSIPIDIGKQAADLSQAFAYEVREATAILMYLLEGVENARLRANLLPPGKQLLPVVPGVAITSNLDGYSRDGLYGPEGTLAQAAFKGWLTQVDDSWTEPTRSKTRKAMKRYGVGFPEADVLGDFHKIRNDLVHHRREASKDNAGRCELLKWFEVGQEIVLNMGHVLDFLNHLDLLTLRTVIHPGGKLGCRWEFIHGESALRSFQPQPKLVSARLFETSFDPPPGQLSIGASLAFDNGMYGLHEFYELEQNAHLVDDAKPDENGDLRFNGGAVETASDLYQHCLDSHFKPEETKTGTTPGLLLNFPQKSSETKSDE